jgi:cell division protein YceG involved in septum cleavage
MFATRVRVYKRMEDFIMSKMFYNKRRNYHNHLLFTVIERKPAVFITGTIILAIMILAMGILSTNVSAKKIPFREKTVVSVKIEEGDTLWSIASQYITEEYQDMNTYIKEIKKTNGLFEDTIHEGKYIIVPYFKTKEVANSSW